jgi:Type II secretion system (T2SS), protein E, N-terminal domain
MGKLGQLLVARGWITVQQLTRALKTQNVGGGRIGACLLEMDAISEELLLKGLAEHLGVSSVAVEDLRNIPEEVLALIPDKLARRCRAVPFRLEVGRLDVAMMDPRNLSAQDEIAFASGKRVKVYVAHELRILEALERYYGEEMPSRYGMILDRLNRARFLWERPAEKAEEPEVFDPRNPFATPPKLKPPPPLPEPPRSAPPPAAPVAAFPATAAAPVLAAAARTESAEEAPAPRTAPPPRPKTVALTPEERAELGAFGWSEPAGAADRAIPAPANLGDAEAALAKAKDLDEVGQILLGFLGRSHRRVALFQATRDRVVGWRIHGANVDPAVFSEFSVGFDQPSLFLNLRQGGSVYFGPLPPMPAHRQLARAWGGDLPRDCVMLPVRIKDRLVMLIYADGASKGPVELPQMQRLAAAATAAVERCILQRKRGEAKS